MKSFKQVLLIAALMLFLTPVTTIIAQPPPPPTGNPCWPPPCVPIDGGISFLVAAGIGLGAKKLYDSRKK